MDHHPHSLPTDDDPHPIRQLPRRVPVVIIPSIKLSTPRTRSHPVRSQLTQSVPALKRAAPPSLASSTKRPRRSAQRPPSPALTRPPRHPHRGSQSKPTTHPELSEDQVLLKPTRSRLPPTLPTATKLHRFQLPSPSSSGSDSDSHSNHHPHPQVVTTTPLKSKPKPHPRTVPVRRYSPSKPTHPLRASHPSQPLSSRPESPTRSLHRSPPKCLTELSTRHAPLGSPRRVLRDVDVSLLEQVEGMMTQTIKPRLTSKSFSSSSIHPHPGIQNSDHLVSDVDERCLEVISQNLSSSDGRLAMSDDDDDDDDDDEEEDRTIVMKRLLSSPSRSPRRLSSVSPLEACLVTTTSTNPQSTFRKSPRKKFDDLLPTPSPSTPEGDLQPTDPSYPYRSEPTLKPTGSTNQASDSSSSFPSELVLPHLNALLNHLSGLNPLPIRIPHQLWSDELLDSRSQVDLESRTLSIINQTPCLVGLEDVELELRSILLRSISQHEGNVLLLSGARGSGKTAIISRSLSLLRTLESLDGNWDGFITIRLNGLVHYNDKIVLKEICRQLFSSLSSSSIQSDQDHSVQQRKKLKEFEDDLDFDPIVDQEELIEPADDRDDSTQEARPLKFSNYGQGLKNLLEALEPCPSTSSNPPAPRKALVIILEEFDKFSELDHRQSFLYCLLDSVQGNKRQSGICVIGTTSVVDCLDKLEKRVKSRCQSRIRYLHSPRSDVDRLDLLRSLLELSSPPTAPQDAHDVSRVNFIKQWNDHLSQFINHPSVLDWLKFKFELLNDPLIPILQDLNGMVAMIAYRVRRAQAIRFPILNPNDLPGRRMRLTTGGGRGSKDKSVCPSSSVWWSSELSCLELSVLIACQHLASIHHNGIFNLEMAWDLYRQHLQRLSLGAHDHHVGATIDPFDHPPTSSTPTTTSARHIAVRSQVYGREAFELGWERLKRYEIILSIETLTSRAKSKSAGSGGGGALGNRYDWVKLVPFFHQIHAVLHAHRLVLANHLRRWSKNSSD